MLHIKLKNLRKDYGFTQKEVADFLNVERTTYSYYESGRSVPSISTIVRLSELYNVSCDYLIKNGKKKGNPTNIDDLLGGTCEKEREFLCYFRMISTNNQNKIMDIMKTLIERINLF